MAEHAMYFTDDRAQRMYKIRKGVMNFFLVMDAFLAYSKLNRGDYHDDC